jgi:hypothetical protein
MNRIVFSAWMGPGPMSENRADALLSIIKNNGCLNAHITSETLKYWVKPGYPLPILFDSLSAVHKCDYLRCYLLHFYGVGYTDIKPTDKNWNGFFELLEKSDAYGIGYTEIGPQGVAQVGGELEEEMKINYKNLIGLCSMIFRPDTEFTRTWYVKINELLKSKAEQLNKNPARHPQDHFGANFADGSTSAYPFGWTEVGGDIFHPLAFKFHQKIIHADMAPGFQNYR